MRVLTERTQFDDVTARHAPIGNSRCARVSLMSTTQKERPGGMPGEIVAPAAPAAFDGHLWFREFMMAGLMSYAEVEARWI